MVLEITMSLCQIKGSRGIILYQSINGETRRCVLSYSKVTAKY